MNNKMKSTMKKMKEQTIGLMKELIREELPTIISKHKTPVTQEKD